MDLQLRHFRPAVVVWAAPIVAVLGPDRVRLLDRHGMDHEIAEDGLFSEFVPLVGDWALYFSEGSRRGWELRKADEFVRHWEATRLVGDWAEPGVS